MAIAAVILLCVDVALALALGKNLYFRHSLSTTAYALWIVDQVTVWTGRGVWLVGLIVFVLVPLARRRPVHLPEVSDIMQMWLNAAGRKLAARRWSLVLLLLSSAGAMALT